ncbi:Filamentous hemagglutinin [Mannheimia haemolytica]|uniref:Filamentous hemagglutinin n=1 Tax=Mannheimia haemolytica TaxID=75985 RepID=A0A378N5M7_MANHA|nr:Filamentous hemagglutinin [Mannheimia haemolytica]
MAETLIIQADSTAPKNQQPIILQTANGLPQINIQTPNDKGLSHNKYSQFDVAEKGQFSTTAAPTPPPNKPVWCKATRILPVAKRR